MTKHTKEPWHHNISAKYPIYAEQTPGKKDWRHIAGVLGRDDQAEADLRRIVDCVNACAGMEDPARFFAVLVAAIEQCVPQLEHPSDPDRIALRSLLATLRKES